MSEPQGSIFRKTWQWAREHLFSTWVQTFTTIGAFVGFLLSVLTYWELFGKLLAWSEQHATIEAAYLWVTFATITVGAALWLQLLNKVQGELRYERKATAEAQELLRLEQQRGDDGHWALHRTVELVREVALDSTLVTYDWNPLITLMRDHLSKHFGTQETCVTLKVLRGGELVTVGRAGGDGMRSSSGSAEQPSSSHVYNVFKTKTVDGYKKHVVVQDAWALRMVGDEYLKRARLCKFRSIVAFPLRGPKKFEETTFLTNQVFGFLSVDSPKPNQFDKWFDETQTDHSWPDQVLKPTRALDVFYGMADAAATIEKVLAGRKEPRAGTVSVSVSETSHSVGTS